MDEYNFKVIDAQTLGLLRNQCTPDAPWAKLPDQAWSLLADGLAAGLPWRVDSTLLTAYTQPTSKAAQRRQEVARADLELQRDLLLAFPSGLGWFERRYLGRLRVDEGREPVFEASLPAPLPETPLIGLASTFWPDMPPAVWSQVLPLLVKRTTEEVNEVYGGQSVHAIDSMDFGRAYRFLAGADKLVPHPAVNWAGIIDPPPPAQPTPPAPKRRK